LRYPVPKTEEETIKCDMLMFQIIDLRSQFTDTSYSKDDVFVSTLWGGNGIS